MATALPNLTGKSYEYQIGDYHLHVSFEGERQIHWTYLDAPDGQTGKNAVETIDVMVAIRKNVVLLEWKEASDTQVIDVWDLEEMMLYVSYVTADGQRSFAQTELKRAT